jgi:hypothetical protein
LLLSSKGEAASVGGLIIILIFVFVWKRRPQWRLALQISHGRLATYWTLRSPLSLLSP